MRHLTPEFQKTLNQSLIQVLDEAFISRINCEHIEDLVKRGADVNLEGSLGRTPMSVACTNDSNDKLHFIELLIKYGADINYQNAQGNTPLMFACMYGRLKGVEILLSLGADITLKNKRGTDAFKKAAMGDYAAISETLNAYVQRFEESNSSERGLAISKSFGLR